MNKKRVTIIVAVIMAVVAGTFLVGYGVSAGTDNRGADKAGKKVTAEKEQKDEKQDKEDKEVKEDEQTANKAEANESSKSGNDTAKSSNSSNKTSKSGSSTSASSTPGSSSSGSSSKPVHTHSWTAVYTQGVTGYESKWVGSQIVCNDCGAVNPSSQHLKDEILAGRGRGTHAEEVYETVPVYGQVFSHYACSCGATK